MIHYQIWTIQDLADRLLEYTSTWFTPRYSDLDVSTPLNYLPWLRCSSEGRDKHSPWGNRRQCWCGDMNACVCIFKYGCRFYTSFNIPLEPIVWYFSLKMPWDVGLMLLVLTCNSCCCTYCSFPVQLDIRYRWRMNRIFEYLRPSTPTNKHKHIVY